MRLYKEKEGKVFAGVCAGMARSIGMDVTWMRIIWAAVAVITWIVPVIVAYVVLAVALPENSDGTQSVPAKKAGLLSFSAFLIALGVFILLDALIPYALSKLFFPICLIGAGVIVILWALKRKK